MPASPVKKHKRKRQMTSTSNQQSSINLEKMMTHLKLQWQAPNPHTAQNFTALTSRLSCLMNDLQKNPALEFLDQQFYPEWRVLNREDTTSTINHDSIFSLPDTSTDAFRQGFYFCNHLIQLMEDVYLDLDLETHSEHPDNRGWINLFRHWSWSAMFQACWTITACTFGTRFQRFCQFKLNMTLGTVTAGLVDYQEIEKSTLNAFELFQIKTVYNIYQQSELELNIHLLNLHIDPLIPTSSQKPKTLLPVFNFGYAISYELADSNKTETDVERKTEPCSKTRAILIFRVQDHLRKLGLGNAGLSALATPYLKGSAEVSTALVLDPGYFTHFKLTTNHHGNEQQSTIKRRQQTTSIKPDNDEMLKILEQMLDSTMLNREVNKQSIAQFTRMLDSVRVRLA
jgi:hypothetical protein